MKEKKLMAALELSSGHLQLRKLIASYLEITLNDALRACKKPVLAHQSEKYGKTTGKTRNQSGYCLASHKDTEVSSEHQ